MDQIASQTKPSLSPSRFRGQVLNKVYRVWLFRRLLPVLIAEIAVFAALLYIIGENVFVERVFQNGVNVLFTDPMQLPTFFISAFLHAPRMTEIVIIVAAFALAFLVRHLTQGMLRFILVRQNYFGKINRQ